MPVQAPLYPVGLVLADRPCLVVGGGPVAAHKVEALLLCGADVTVVAPEVVPELDRPRVIVERRRYRRGEASRYRLVITATDDPAVNQAVHDDAEAAGVWVNSADDPERCSFTLPAVVRRDPVVVAVSTGGTSPALAAWLRDRVAVAVGPEAGEAAVLLAAARARLHGAGVSTESLHWHPVVERLIELLRDGDDAAARSMLDRWVAEATGRSPAAEVE